MKGYVDIIFVIATILRILALILVAVLAGVFFTLMNITVGSREIERAAVDIAENMMHHNLVSSRTVLDKRELDTFNGKLTEPYFRHCRYGYSVKFKDLKNNRVWEFGYPSGFALGIEVQALSAKYPVSVGVVDAARPVNYYDTVVPAEMELTVRDTWLSRMTCLIDNAYRLNKSQAMKIPSAIGSYPALQCPPGGCPVGPSLRKKGGDQNSDAVCVFLLDSNNKVDTSDCRYLPGIRVHDFAYGGRPGETKNLSALPIKTGSALPHTTVLCRDIRPFEAQENDPVDTIALCVED